MIYMFNKLLFIFITFTRNEGQKIQLELMNIRFDIGDIFGVKVNYIFDFLQGVFNSNLDSYIYNTFSSYLELSSYIDVAILFVGLAQTLLGWFWLTATLLALIWLDFAKSISAMFFFLFLIIRKTYFNIRSLFIIPFLLFILMTFTFYYYSIQVVYSLYLVQLAGGRGDECQSYFRLRRMVLSNTKQTMAKEYRYGDKNKSSEIISFIEKQKDDELNV
ncbi:hypothetical protein FG386_000843 [Cryptosporidium ryanae]|uniref:uncharacterized protein n=1 Tax=Cryptosporidium ryanae TaxID=515981 RepID=UPI003519ECE6|nr:hypothetical protein FG386_000843 [Cryptosporidium ryanae]